MIVLQDNRVRKLLEAVHDAGGDKVYQLPYAGTYAHCLDHIVAPSPPPSHRRVYLTTSLSGMVILLANPTLLPTLLVGIFMFGPPTNNAHAYLAVGVHIEHGFAEMAPEGILVVVRSRWRQAVFYWCLQTLHRTNGLEDIGLRLYSHAEQL